MEQYIEKQNTKRRSTFAVLFYINRTKIRKDGMCQLLCKVSIDAEWAQIGTKYLSIRLSGIRRKGVQMDEARMPLL